ncbi:MAG TPA: hypothetical protein VHB98_19890, partial [Chloroflexota bacterium]|nr:hypothetical protein [Chloroflexota bacterium]
MADQQQGGADERAQDEGSSQQDSTQGNTPSFENRAREVVDRVIEKIQEVAPVVGERIQGGVGAGVRKVEEVAPEIGGKVLEGIDVVVRKVEEAAPVVGEKVQQGAAKLGDAVEGWRDKLATRGDQQAGQDTT